LTAVFIMRVLLVGRRGVLVLALRLHVGSSLRACAPVPTRAPLPLTASRYPARRSGDESDPEVNRRGADPWGVGLTRGNGGDAGRAGADGRAPARPHGRGGGCGAPRTPRRARGRGARRGGLCSWTVG